MATPTASQASAPGFATHPGYRVDIEPCAKRVRVRFGGETVADSLRVLLVRESGHVPVYYFPAADVRHDLIAPSDHRTGCPFKGDASYWSVRVGDRNAENAIWSYRSPYPEVRALAGHFAFYWERMDAWFEEDEEVFVHARDPHVRIDILDSSRSVRVVLGGQTVAESTRARFLFETGLPTRYYIPAEDVRSDLFSASDTTSACPYKGTADYASARIGGREYRDVAWRYAEPLPEAARIRDRWCFFDERVDAILVDGVPQPKPKTRWTRG